MVEVPNHIFEAFREYLDNHASDIEHEINDFGHLKEALRHFKEEDKAIMELQRKHLEYMAERDKKALSFAELVETGVFPGSWDRMVKEYEGQEYKNSLGQIPDDDNHKPKTIKDFTEAYIQPFASEFGKGVAEIPNDVLRTAVIAKLFSMEEMKKFYPPLPEDAQGLRTYSES